ncbi:Bug family tripartite tricarboxylate transporter substrate binding protein [Roseovarius autotrophicus]|uniref:Bug family tripartite tricarboxylate transporter substrate binding protein n=1 Tax=Roseovarius autotrophicus TaxID=2824121 RepID=UPI0019E684F6|nr:tripartite tricarboxylate transporter substrate binding protein [Roseovarius autotrophicus]MBE0453018.1 tripartite tricarboxylate transporter substrate binding protein [Roseovarius sp.]
MNILKSMALGIAALTISAPAAMAEWQPRKPIDFVIMAGPGGGADRIARFIQSVAEKKKLTRRPLIPNNKGGGSGAESLIWLNSTNDPDHTILVTLNSFFTTPIRQPDLGIDIQTFTPIAMMGVDPFALWVHSDSGIETFEQWLEAVRAADGEYVTGGTGTGQEDSIVFAYLDNAFELKTKYIPFDGGGAVAAALAGQQIMATVNNPSEARGFYDSGDLRPLLVFSDEQMDVYPGIPTLKEKGKDFSYYNQRAIVGAPGMSDEAAAYYQKLFEEIYNSEEWQGYLETEAMSPLWMEPDEQRAYWEVQVQTHSDLLARIN